MFLMAEQTVRTDLSDLVKHRREELGLSDRALAPRCIDPDTGEAPFAHAWLGRLQRADPSVKAPKINILRALAEGLRLPLEVVRDAAIAQYMGIDPIGDAIWSKDRSIRITVARMSELSEADRAEFAQLAELWTRGKRQPGSNPEPQ